MNKRKAKMLRDYALKLGIEDKTKRRYLKKGWNALNHRQKKLETERINNIINS